MSRTRSVLIINLWIGCFFIEFLMDVLQKIRKITHFLPFSRKQTSGDYSVTDLVTDATQISIFNVPLQQNENINKFLGTDLEMSNSGAPAAEGLQAEPHTHIRELKGTHELIFSCVPWLVVLLVGAYARRRWRRGRRRRRRRWSRATWRPYSNNRLTEHAALVYHVLLWYRTSMLWSTDTCQNKVSADQYHVTISRAQLNNSSRSRVFPKLTADQMMVFFDWIAGSCPVNLFKTGQDCLEAG